MMKQERKLTLNPNSSLASQQCGKLRLLGVLPASLSRLLGVKARLPYVIYEQLLALQLFFA